MRNVLFIVLSWGLSSCTQNSLTKQKLQEFLLAPENGLVKTIERNGIQMTVTYRPNDLFVLQELGESRDPRVIDSIRGKYDRNLYFVLSYSAGKKELLGNSGKSMEAFSEALQTMAFRMGEFVFLTDSNNSTFKLADFALERTFGYASSTNILLVFNLPKDLIGETPIVEVHVDEFGLGLGNQSFEFLTSDISHCPGIRF